MIVHELAHEMLRCSRNGGRPPNAVRETEAEAVAIVVSKDIGLDTTTTATDYSQLYTGDKQTLAASPDRIQQTATAIIRAVSEPAE